MELKFGLHPGQLEVFKSPARFRVVTAGRRFGKSFLSCIELLIEGLKTENSYGNDIRNKEVWYIAPTFQQAKDIMWSLLKDLGKDVIESTHENTATIRLINGRRIQLKGSDRPDTLRGVGISFAVMDEYAFMKPEVWDLIIRPTLADVRGRALFIGTPEGKNHFYDLWMSAHDAQTSGNNSWESFSFKTIDNPTIAKEEIEEARAVMTAEAFRQEFEASFEAAGGGAFREKDIVYSDTCTIDGHLYIAVDPAGFGEGAGMVKSKLSRLDEHAIAIVTAGTAGWYVHEIITGRWNIRETSLQIVRAAQKYKPVALGIESGSLKNAIMPYLEDQMRRLNVYPVIEPLTHGGKKKTERILWALQGRFQNKRIVLNEGDWNRKFVEQLLNFPNPLSHDDMLDALAYIDQLATVAYNTDIEFDNWSPIDVVAGF